MDKDFEKLNRLIQSAKEFFACPECKELAARAKWYAADFQRRYLLFAYRRRVRRKAVLQNSVKIYSWLCFS